MILSRGSMRHLVQRRVRGGDEHGVGRSGEPADAQRRATGRQRTQRAREGRERLDRIEESMVFGRAPAQSAQKPETEQAQPA